MTYPKHNTIQTIIYPAMDLSIKRSVRGQIKDPRINKCTHTTRVCINCNKLEDLCKKYLEKGYKCSFAYCTNNCNTYFYDHKCALVYVNHDSKTVTIIYFNGYPSIKPWGIIGGNHTKITF